MTKSHAADAFGGKNYSGGFGLSRGVSQGFRSSMACIGMAWLAVARDRLVRRQDFFFPVCPGVWYCGIAALYIRFLSGVLL